MMNRIVVLLSPALVGIAGWVVELAARYLPGHPRFDKGQLAGLFIAGGTWMAAHLLLWLHGWQKHEARAGPPAVVPKTAAVPKPKPPAKKAASKGSTDVASQPSPKPARRR